MVYNEEREESVQILESRLSVANNQPLPSVLNHVYETLDRRYKKNLKLLYVVRRIASFIRVLVRAYVSVVSLSASTTLLAA